MYSPVLGAAAACAASALYNAGVALQALEARAAPATDAMRPSLLARLLRRPRWVAGTLLGVAGWPLQALAVGVAPLAVAQPALACGLVLLLFLGARLLREPVSLRDAAAVAGIVGGVAVLAITAPVDEGAGHGNVRTALVLAVIAVIGAAPFVVSLGRSVGGRLAALAAGAGFAWSGLSTKLFADAVGRHAWVVALAWAAATGLASGIALVAEMSALQRRRATEVAPLVFVVQVLIPVLAAPLLLTDHWTGSSLTALGAAGGLAAVVGGAVVLASSPTVDAGRSGAVQEPGASLGPVALEPPVHA